MPKILLTGSKGIVGGVLYKALSKDYEVIGLDLPEADISDYNLLLEHMQGVDIVLHMAFAEGESWRSGGINPTNVALEMNIFHAVAEAGVKRLIMASSVHADDFNNYEGTKLLTVPGSFKPTSPYGTHKLIVEETGRFYAQHFGIEFIGVRFGGVTPDDKPKEFLREPQVWLSHSDLAAAIRACVTTKTVPNNFSVFYAVSNNQGRLHDTANPFGWEPHDNSANQPSS